MSSVAKSSPWRLDGTTAHFATEGFSAVVELLQPAEGLHVLHGARHTRVDGSVLGVQLRLADAAELSLPETYVRGDDLVATYTQTVVRPYRLQAYWRFLDPATLAGCRNSVVFELQVSINTGLLDVRPAVEVTTALGGVTQKEITGGLLLHSQTTDGPSYFEAAHPSDATSVQAADVGDGVRVVHRLFDRPLEKGVILRSRIRGAFVPSADDEATADALFRDFAASRPPLTT